MCAYGGKSPSPKKEQELKTHTTMYRNIENTLLSDINRLERTNPFHFLEIPGTGTVFANGCRDGALGKHCCKATVLAT